MNNLFRALALALPLCLAALSHGQPTVSNVRSGQVLGSHQVVITYDLANAGGLPSTVSVQVSDNGGASYAVEVPSNAFSGAVGPGIAPGVGKEIVFTPSETPLGSVYSKQIRFRVSAVTESQVEGFAFVPAGNFIMGSPSEELGRKADEVQHQVTLTRNLYVAETEVTNTQMAEVLNWALGQGLINATETSVSNVEGDSRELLNLVDDPDNSLESQISFADGTFVVDEGKLSHPCLNVTWYGALAYCHFLARMEGDLSQAVDLADWSVDFSATGYRLPTEAEWEYACRAGTTTAFYTGPITSPNANPLDPNLDLAGWYLANSGTATRAVARKQVSPWGLYDTHGNVFEWCWDWYGPYTGDVTDPTGPGSGEERVARGGSRGNFASFCRSAARISGPANAFNNLLGFRVVRNVAGSQ